MVGKRIGAGPRTRSRHRRACTPRRRVAPGATPSSAASPAAAGASRASAGRGARKVTWCGSSAQSGGPPARGASARLCFSRPRTCAGQLLGLPWPRVFAWLPATGGRMVPACRSAPAGSPCAHAPPRLTEQVRTSACAGLSPLCLGGMRATAWRGGCSVRGMQCCTGGARPHRTRPSRPAASPPAAAGAAAGNTSASTGGPRAAAAAPRRPSSEPPAGHGPSACRAACSGSRPSISRPSVRCGVSRTPPASAARWLTHRCTSQALHTSDDGAVCPGTDLPPDAVPPARHARAEMGAPVGRRTFQCQ
jgi:hypothetical protein